MALSKYFFNLSNFPFAPPTKPLKIWVGKNGRILILSVCSSTLHCTVQYCSTLHCAALHCTTSLHCTALPYYVNIQYTQVCKCPPSFHHGIVSIRQRRIPHLSYRPYFPTIQTCNRILFNSGLCHWDFFFRMPHWPLTVWRYMAHYLYCKTNWITWYVVLL